MKAFKAPSNWCSFIPSSKWIFIEPFGRCSYYLLMSVQNAIIVFIATIIFLVHSMIFFRVPSVRSLMRLSRAMNCVLWSTFHYIRV
jgi:hypothetical protein